MDQKSTDVQSRFTNFLDEVYICGVKEYARTNFCFIKFCWIIIVCVGTLATAYYLRDILGEYNKMPIATKIEFDRRKEYDFPNIVLCPDVWVDVETRLDISAEAIGFGLGHIYSIKGQKFIVNANHYATNRDEFVRFLHTNNIRDYRDFYAFVAKAWNRFFGKVNYLENKLELNVTAIFNGARVCYRLSLPPVDCSKQTLNLAPTVEVYFDDYAEKTDPLNMPKSGNHMLEINPDLKLSVDTPSNSNLLEGGKFYALSIFPKKYFALNKPPEKICVSIGDTETVWDGKYSQPFCHSNCIQRNYYRIYEGCMMANLHRPYPSDSTKTNLTYCSDITCKNSCRPGDLRAFGEIVDQCDRQCGPPCEHDLYEISMSQSGSPETRRCVSENRDNPDAVNSCYNTSVLQILYDVCGKGVMEIREFRRYTFDGLIADIGGVLGLWVGASAITFVQAIMCSLEMAMLKFSNCGTSNKAIRVR